MVNRPLNLQIDWNSVFNTMIAFVVVVGMTRILSRAISGKPALLPQTIHGEKRILRFSTTSYLIDSDTFAELVETEKLELLQAGGRYGDGRKPTLAILDNEIYAVVRYGGNINLLPVRWEDLSQETVSEAEEHGLKIAGVAMQAQVKRKEFAPYQVTVECPICGEVIEIPEYDTVTRTEALKIHIEKKHSSKRRGIITVDFSNPRWGEIATRDFAKSQGFTEKVWGDIAWRNPKNPGEFIRFKSSAHKILKVYDSRSKTIIEVPTILKAEVAMPKTGVAKELVYRCLDYRKIGLKEGCGRWSIGRREDVFTYYGHDEYGCNFCGARRSVFTISQYGRDGLDPTLEVKALAKVKRTVDFANPRLLPQEKSPEVSPQTKPWESQKMLISQWRRAWHLKPGEYLECQCGYRIEVAPRGLKPARRYELMEKAILKHLPECPVAKRMRIELSPSLLPQVMIEGGEPVPSQYRDLTGWISEPLPEYSLLVLPAVVPEVGERKIDAVLKQLKDGVETIQQSERFHLFLVTMSKFYDYSIGNQILIMIQKRDATRVAGFNTWKDLGRWVKKSERGIAILAPVMPPRWTCPECGAKLPKGVRFCPKCGERVEVEEEIEVTPRYFKVVYVFDISQTEGKPLPEFEVPALTGEANEELFGKVMALAKAEGLTVSFESRPKQDPEIKGEYFGKSIWIRPEESRAQQLKSLIHEVAHYYSEGVFRIPRRDAETIAESAAFAIGAHFGFDSGVRSFPYVALWAQDKKVLEQNLAAVRRVAAQIIESLEKEKIW